MRLGRVQKMSPPQPRLFLFSSTQFVLHPHLFLCLECPASYLTTHNTNINAPGGFEPAIRASGRPQTLALNRAATGIGRIRPRTVQSVTGMTELSRPQIYSRVTQRWGFHAIFYYRSYQRQQQTVNLTTGSSRICKGMKTKPHRPLQRSGVIYRKAL